MNLPTFTELPIFAISLHSMSAIDFMSATSELISVSVPDISSYQNANEIRNDSELITNFADQISDEILWTDSEFSLSLDEYTFDSIRNGAYRSTFYNAAKQCINELADHFATLDDSERTDECIYSDVSFWLIGEMIDG